MSADFILQVHLRDEIKFKGDLVKKLISLLTILLAVCSSSVSIAANGDIQRVTVINESLARSGTQGHRQAYNDEALRTLCEQGYTLALYVYTVNSQPRTVSCSRGTISYETISWDGRNTARAVDRAASEINQGGKVMVQCWYGVHASNFIASLVLKRQFGYSGEQAAALFEQGVPPRSLPQSRIDELSQRIINF